VYRVYGQVPMRWPLREEVMKSKHHLTPLDTPSLRHALRAWPIYQDCKHYFSEELTADIFANP
jgi:hypothetical protein